MRRKIFDQLVRWKDKSSRMPLILNGARQVDISVILTPLSVILTPLNLLFCKRTIRLTILSFFS
jgi:hypothetical protein